MIQKFNYNTNPIGYTDLGNGPALVFLHGYLLSHEIWIDFVQPLIKDYRVLCVDLPGHGQSALPAPVSTMEVMGEVLKALLDHLSIPSGVFFGHSMGGYAALALLEKHPELVTGISLFHSHPYADNEEVKSKRDREIALINQGHKNLLVGQSIPNMFATDRLQEHSDELEFCKSLARKMDDQAVKASILGLKARSDRSEILAHAKCPCLNIAGRKDNFIPFKEVAEKIVLPSDSELLVAEESGHMGFYEQPDFILQGVRQFLKRIL